MSEPHVRKRVRIEGRVQGVGFRWFTRSAARREGVVGWVENRPDGTVLCEVQGATPRVESFLRAVAEGPAFARVDRTTVDDLEAAARPETAFEVRAHGRD